MDLDRGIGIKAGVVEGVVFGGPYRKYKEGTRRLIGVKMAAEIDHPHDISVPTEDFSIPDDQDLEDGIIGALDALATGKDVYVGCMGGIGRTGLFMGVMIKAVHEYNEVKEDPVLFVRSYYNHHAVETEQQRAFVRGFDTSAIVTHLNKLNGKERALVAVEKRPTTWAELFWGFWGFRGK